MYLLCKDYLVSVDIQIIRVQHILKGGSEQIHDVILFVERCDPSANVVHLVMSRNAVLGKGDELVFIILMHVVICHLVLAEIQANHEKSALWIGVRLIDEHWWMMDERESEMFNFIYLPL